MKQSNTKTRVYDIMVAEEFQGKDGQGRVQYHRAGVAFENSRGGFNCEITRGMALTGRFVIFPKQDQASRSSSDRNDASVFRTILLALPTLALSACASDAAPARPAQGVDRQAYEEPAQASAEVGDTVIYEYRAAPCVSANDRPSQQRRRIEASAGGRISIGEWIDMPAEAADAASPCTQNLTILP